MRRKCIHSRVELRVIGYYSYSEAVDLAISLVPLDGLPKGVKMTRTVAFSDYITFRPRWMKLPKATFSLGGTRTD